MKNSDLERFSAAWKQVHKVYGKTPDRDATMFAFQLLADLEIDDICRSLADHARDPDTGQYPPKPADVVRLCRGTKTDQAAAAWTILLEEGIKRTGPWQSVKFDDPIIGAVVADMGGWTQICQVESKELPFIAADFQRRYQGYLRRPDKPRNRELAGIATQHNEAQGLAYDSPAVPVGHRLQHDRSASDDYDEGPELSPAERQENIRRLKKLTEEIVH